MRFGYWIGSGHDWGEIRRSGVRAEETGWNGVWFADHLLPADGGSLDRPCHEVWSVLAGLADATENVRLGPLVCGNTYRNPGLLMKQAVTTDHISGGRIVLGLGAGWMEEEHTAYGFEFGTFSDRFDRLEEALQIIRSMRSEATTTLDGARYRVLEAPLEPKPVGPLPILIGGGGERKTLRMVAQYADEWNVWAEPELMRAKIEVLDRQCETVGRDPADIERSAVALLFLCEDEAEVDAHRAAGAGRQSLIGTPAQLVEQVGAYAEMGVDELIVPDWTLGDPVAKDDLADRFLAEVAAEFR